MIPIPFFVGAALGAATVLVLKRKQGDKPLTDTVSDGVKSGIDGVTDAAATVGDTVKSTIKTIKEKNEVRREARNATEAADSETPTPEQQA